MFFVVDESSQAGTMQLIWGARAARPRFSASGRKLSAATWENCLVYRSSAKTSRRDADWSDRDGRAPHFLLNRSGLDPRSQTQAHYFASAFIYRHAWAYGAT